MNAECIVNETEDRTQNCYRKTIGELSVSEHKTGKNSGQRTAHAFQIFVLYLYQYSIKKQIIVNHN